jgi:hypothetical protein
MRALLLLASLLAGGCLNGDFNSNDASASVRDMANARIYDLAGVDLYGAYNCSALNACDRACTTKACVFMCRNMATPTAVQKEIDLQNCFTQYCPNGAGQVCQPDAMGMLSSACMICISNTQLANNADCSPSQLPSECHMCLAQAAACAADT